MAFYDGAKKLAEITQPPTQFTAKNLTPGYHLFSVLATEAMETCARRTRRWSSCGRCPN